MTPKVTHTHTHALGREVCVASILPGKEAPPSCPLCEAHVHAEETDENERRDRQKVCVGLPMKKNQVKRDNR